MSEADLELGELLKNSPEYHGTYRHSGLRGHAWTDRHTQHMSDIVHSPPLSVGETGPGRYSSH